jgi:predicted regulator of Ras-like GTPase activity (Roadblock/LC7/MglB family)
MDETILATARGVLADLRDRHGVPVSMILSAGGVPVAWQTPPHLHTETFATLTATITGSCEVVFQGLGRPGPKRLVIQTSEGTLATAWLGPKMLLAAFIPVAAADGALAAFDDAARALRGILRAS